MSEKIKEKAKSTYNHLRVLPFAFAGLTALKVKETEGVRDHLPEPFDVPDHLGNVGHSLVPGFVAGLAAGKLYTYFERSNSEDEAWRKTRIVKGMAGFCVGLAINVWAEAKTGHSLTPDPIDVVYGTYAASTAAIVGPETPLRKRSVEDDTVVNGSHQAVDSEVQNIATTQSREPIA